MVLDPLVLGNITGEGVGLTEDGRDQPWPAALDDCGAAVSFVVINREWDVEGWALGLAINSSIKVMENRINYNRLTNRASSFT